MRMDRTLAISRKVLRSLKHDRRTAGFLVLMPLFMIAVFGYAFGGSVKDLPVYVVNLDRGYNGTLLSDMIVEDLHSRDVLEIDMLKVVDAATWDPVAAALDKVEKAEVRAAIVFYSNFTADAMAALDDLRLGLPAAPATMGIFIDATNPNVAQAITADLQRAIQTVTVGDMHLVPPIALDQELVYGEGAEFIDFFAPGVMGLAAMMVTFMLSIISFVHERTTGTLDRLLTTPVTEGEIVCGYAAALGLVALIQSTIIISAAVLLFQIHIEGNILLALMIIFLLGIGNQGLGFLLSSNARNEFQAVQFMPLILFPSILLAGVFWPLEAVPDFLRPISYFIPLTYAVDGARSVMIRGWGIGDVWFQVLVLVLFAAIMLLLSAYSLKKRR